MRNSLLIAAGLTAAVTIPTVAQAFWWGGDKQADAPAAFRIDVSSKVEDQPIDMQSHLHQRHLCSTEG